MPVDGDGNLEVAASTIVARLASGDLKDASIAEILTLLNVSAGAEVNPDVVPQLEAEAGTATTERIWTAQRVKQAIDALASGAGDVSGPASSTDNALARFDLATGKLLQNGVVIADDSGNLSGIGNITLSGTVDGIDIATDVAANTAKVTNATHTGDVTGSEALTIAANAVTTSKILDSNVTLAKLADIATNRIIGRDTAGTGVPESLTAPAVRSIINVENGADVTDTANVTAAGALMDSEVDADIKTLSLPASTTISTFGASLVDDANAAAARTTLDVDQAGTDNSTDVTLAGTPDYITLSGQVLTRNQIDLTADVTGLLPTDNIADELIKVLNNTSTQAATTAVTTEEDLLSYTLPGGTLANTGDAVRIKWWGVTANNTNNKTLRFYWDGTAIYDSGALPAQASQWLYECIIHRTGAATQDIMQWFGFYNGAVITPNFSPSLAATLSGDVIIKCTGQNAVASANDMINHGMSVEYLPAA